MNVKKRNGTFEPFDKQKIISAIQKAFLSCNEEVDDSVIINIANEVDVWDNIDIEDIQDQVIELLYDYDFEKIAQKYSSYREYRNLVRHQIDSKKEFINNYKYSSNTANATIDDNSNVGSKNIGILNAEIHKSDNLKLNRNMVVYKLKELFPEFDSNQYIKDLEHHIIYKHDESSFAGAIAPYCVSMTMYPFLLNGIKDIGGLSAAPKNLDSFCGMYINLIFAASAMFAGAVATSEVLLYFTYFCKKEWGNNFYLNPDKVISINSNKSKTIRSQIHQYWQQIIYSINQPAAARGLQSAFVNFSYFDKPFFEGMFGDFYFPDGTQPDWESLNWIQKEFMQWFNAERLRCMLTFPVESFALVYKDGEFVDKDSAEFVAQEYARGHSFFTYISDTVDSLSSCCRLKNMVKTKEFNFTNGNIGVQTGSKSVITLNLNRITQDYFRTVDTNYFGNTGIIYLDITEEDMRGFQQYIINILERVYKYHIAYNELLWDMYNANLLPVYKAGFIDLNKQYLTIGINGLNQSAEFLGINCKNTDEYKKFCKFIFNTIKESNSKANGTYNEHKLSFNTELVPAESLAVKNYTWDQQEGYYIPKDTNLYASYIFKPNDLNISVLDKLFMHGKNFANDQLDGGAAAHINLDHHLSVEQYRKLLKYAGEVGCQYFTFNIPNCECDKCGFIAKQPFTQCPKCGSTNISLWDRIIGYLTKIKNWSTGRQIEQKTRVYSKNVKI